MLLFVYDSSSNFLHHPHVSDLKYTNKGSPDLFETSKAFVRFVKNFSVEYYPFFILATASLISSSLTVVLPACFARVIASRETSIP